MSLCGAFVTLALNATLLGDQSLKLERQHVVSTTTCSAENEAVNPNAEIALKDSKGHVVFKQKIRVSDFDFYFNEKERGGLPAKSAVILLNYPRTAETSRATVVDVRMLEFPFHQKARLPQLRPNPQVDLKSTHELSLR